MNRTIPLDNQKKSVHKVLEGQFLPCSLFNLKPIILYYYLYKFHLYFI